MALTRSRHAKLVCRSERKRAYRKQHAPEPKSRHRGVPRLERDAPRGCKIGSFWELSICWEIIQVLVVVLMVVITAILGWVPLAKCMGGHALF